MPKSLIRANISFLIQGRQKLVLDDDMAAGVSAITVESILGAAINQILFLREPGSEKAEIIATHSATAPTGNTVTLATTLVESHPRGTVVYIVPWNQVRFYSAPTAVDANADASTLTALAAAQDIDPTTVDNIYTDEVTSSGYFYYRFSDSINSINDVYSDPIPYGVLQVVFAKDTVGYILEFVRRKLGNEWDERFSKQAAMQEINDCFEYIQGELKHWGRYLVPDYVLGQTTRGVYDYPLPSDIYDNETNKSILSVRIGDGVNPLIPYDEKEFDNLLDTVAHTQVRTQALAADTSLAIDNSYDFDDSGSVNIYTSNAVDAITYTEVTRSATAGILTGVPASGTGAVGTTHAVDTNVWQGESEGEPRYFNVRSGRLRMWPLPSAEWVNKNVKLDYNQEATVVDSESDTLDTPRRGAVREWLLWKGKSYWRNNGADDLKDANFALFTNIVKKAIRTEVSGQKYKMRPAINQILYRPRRKPNFDGS